MLTQSTGGSHAWNTHTHTHVHRFQDAVETVSTWTLDFGTDIEITEYFPMVPEVRVQLVNDQQLKVRFLKVEVCIKLSIGGAHGVAVIIVGVEFG